MDEQVASSTQNHALNAVVFLYKKVIKKEIGDFSDFPRARRGLCLPVVASRAEIKAVIGRLEGRERLMCGLLYGTGMRIEEFLGMRVQDVHFDQNRIVAHGKGDKDRYVPLPAKYAPDLRTCRPQQLVVSSLTPPDLLASVHPYESAISDRLQRTGARAAQKEQNNKKGISYHGTGVIDFSSGRWHEL